VISLISGSAVMAFELLSAKAIAPVYGQSLPVWACVIGVTLGALTLGYFLGGSLIDRRPTDRTLAVILLGAGLLCGIIPYLADPFLTITEPLGLRIGTLAACILILVGPLGALGMVTPAATRLATRQVEKVGKTAGTIYAVSTVGGVVSSIGCGLYTIPYWGITTTALVTAGLLVAAALLVEFTRRLQAAAGQVAVLLIAVPLIHAWMSPEPGAGVRLESEGLFGRLVVVDKGEDRWLFIDGVPQTSMNRETARSRFRYVHCMAYFASFYPPKSRALVLGLGGGTLANELSRLEQEVVAVEIDERIARIARSHFSLDPKVHVVVDDGRRTLRTSKLRYSYIGLDCFAAERTPNHLLTLEAFREMDRILEPNGVVVLQLPASLEGTAGLAPRSILRTLREAGYETFCYGTGPDDRRRDLIIGGMKDPGVFETGRSRLIRDCCGSRVDRMLKNPLDPDLEGAYLVTDDACPLDMLITGYGDVWRRNSRKIYRQLIE
jgi:predicted membrane-bound spermidine synthase